MACQQEQKQQDKHDMVDSCLQNNTARIFCFIQKCNIIINIYIIIIIIIIIIHLYHTAEFCNKQK
jgi:uncharacterized membrane protein YvbJ